MVERMTYVRPCFPAPGLQDEKTSEKVVFLNTNKKKKWKRKTNTKIDA